MGIESNTGPSVSAQPQDDRTSQGAASSNFGGTDFSNAAPQGRNDFLGLKNYLGLSRIDSTVEPYLEKIKKLVADNMTNTSLIQLQRVSNAYAIMHESSDGTLNFFGIQFVSASDPVSQFMYPASIKLRPLAEEIKSSYPNSKVRLVDARIILAGYEPEMALAYEMADTIVRTLRVSSDADAKNAQIKVLTSNEFVADWRLSEARNTERMLSPHGVRPRMDVGLTLKAKIRNDLGREFREFDVDYQTLGVIGGYTEIREKEPVVVGQQTLMLYRPVFNITVCNAAIPLEGVAAILLAALAPTIYNTHFWLQQWQNLNKDNPNPGMLEEDQADRGKPLVLKDKDELLEFVKLMFAQPIIAFQFQDGRDTIPGMFRLAATDPTAKNHFVNRLTHFFGAPEENAGGVELSRVIESRYDGAYGDVASQLQDSRNIDYLYIAATSGVGSIDSNMRRVLLNGSENGTDRAKIVQSVTNSFIPLYLDTQVAINADFIKWIIQKTDANRLVIVDPNSQTEARSIGSFLDGFGTTNNMGSIVSTGAVNRGLGLNSVWNGGFA